MRATFPLAVVSSWLIAAGALAAPPTSNRADLTTDVIGFTSISAGTRPGSTALGKGEECGDTWLTHSEDGEIVQKNSVSCNAGTHTTANSYYRTYEMADFGLGPNFQVCAVTFGVELAESLLEEDQPITVRLYDTVDLSDLAGHLIGEAGVIVENQARTYVTVPIEAATNNGALTVEVHSPDGLATLTRFFIGTNNLGQTSPSYIAAADCGIVEPIDLAEIGFPEVHFLLDVHGFAGDCEVGGPKTLYSVTGGDNDDNLLRTINPFTAETLTETPIVLDDGTFDVLGGNGLAAHPVTGELFAILKIQRSAVERILATIDPATGAATEIGILADKFAGLAFDGDGELYGVTGDGAAMSESLFWIDTGDAGSALVCHFGRGDDGEAIAYNPVDQLLYHASGHTGNENPDDGTGVIFERYLGEVSTFEDCVTEDIDITDTLLVEEETQALTWWPGENVFIWKQDHDSDAPLYRVTMDGEPTLIGLLDHQAKGLAFLGVGGAGGTGIGNFLFVSDSESDSINVPAVLTGDGHAVTVVTDDFPGNATLLGDLSDYDGVFWSATGPGFGAEHDQAVIDNLEAYVVAGGCVYVTGYDSTDSPDDPVLRAFLGAADGMDTPYEPEDPIVVANSLTTGVVNIVGVVPSNPAGDLDELQDLFADTVGVVMSGQDDVGWQWTLRTLGLGHVAFVSNGNSGGAEIENWLVTSPLEDACYNASLRNFAVACANGAGGPGDCNGNGIADVCDLESGFSQDCNNNGIPDECDTAPVEIIDPGAQCADECDDAPLVCPGIIYEGNTFDATASIYPPFQCGLFFGVHDVYCRYIPAYAGTVFIRVEGPRDQWVYSVHTACPPTPANQVDCNETDHFEVVFEAVAGQTYYIRTAAVGFLRGAFEMTLVGPPCLLAPNDANANQIPDECECPADVNNDGVVDQIDLGIVSASQGPCPTPPTACPADVDGNGVVNEIDGMIVASSFGPCPNRDPNGGERP